ncbi:hypothetical protein B566_EDAN015214 [Ephemera danica]|nr:hypothetical protein B566_EDAN015214 [Ephemera danica]
MCAWPPSTMVPVSSNSSSPKTMSQYWWTSVSTSSRNRDNVPLLLLYFYPKITIWGSLIFKSVQFETGSLSEGIYRRSGTVTAISRLLQDFSKDAWAVQLTRAQYTEHDVASALKRFFKDLPDPLIPLDLTPKLCRITARRSLNADEKISKYRRLLKELSPIAFNTTKRLFGHLHFLHRESAKNLMTASNMSAIWGISLMHQKPMELLGEGQTQIAIELITHYPRVYNVSEAEIARELQLLSLFEKYHSSTSVTPKTAQSSGDLKIWISLGKPGSADTVQVAINPQKTAFEVCAELGRGDDHILQEVVLGGALLRPVHATEKVFDVVVRWGYWDETDRKDNQLVLAPCPVYQEILPLAKPPLAACSEVKFADTKSKSFKPSVFELSQAKLCYYKDRKVSNFHPF